MAETWRVVLASGEVREVAQPECARGEAARVHVVREAACWKWPVAEILAPGEPTRAELAAQLAAVTAERDAEAAARYIAQKDRDTQTDALGHALATLRDSVLAALGAQPHEDAAEAAQRVTRERDALAPLVAEARRVMHFARAVVSAWAATTADAGEDWDGVAEAIRTLADEAGDWTLAGPHTTHDALAKACDNAREERDAMRRERDVLRARQAPLLDAHDALVAAARAAGWTGAGATGAELVAWVRLGEREACAERVRYLRGDLGAEAILRGESPVTPATEALSTAERLIGRLAVDDVIGDAGTLRALPLDAPGGAT